MGGNVQVMSLSGEEVLAQKVDLAVIGRREFVSTSNKLFKSLNTLFEARFNRKIWPNEKYLDDATVFNGSTSFVMSNDYSDDEILKAKPTVGDIDVAVPEDRAEQLFELLNALRGRRILSNVEFIGQNRTDGSKLGTQINCIFKFLGDVDFLVQVDFEFLPFEESGEPTEWARFSHSSSFEDTKAGVKAVHHKYLIRAMIGALSVRDDIVIATPKATEDKLTLSKKDTVARMLKFSVDHGVRVAYAPFLREDGTQIYYAGKAVYKEIPTKNSDYKKTVKEIYRLAFGDAEDKDSELLWTFQGTLQLIKKHLNKSQIQATADRYFEMLWGVGKAGGQKLERGDPEEDAAIKGAGWDLFVKKLGLSNPPQFEERLAAYYEVY